MKCRDLCTADIILLLHQGVVRFVIADVGLPLHWIDVAKRFDFWKRDAKCHVSNNAAACIDDFPGEFCYFASLWNDGGSPIVLLAKNR